jgi:hypothetical protein
MKLQLHRQAEMYGESRGWINMSGLNPRLFPAPLPLLHSLQRLPAGARTEALQGTSPLQREVLVAPWPVARVREKNVP